MPDLGKAVFTLTTNSKPFLTGLSAAEAALGVSASRMSKTFMSMGAASTMVGRSLTRKITVPALALGGASIKMSADFQSSMSKIVGLVGISQKQVNAWSKEILKMSADLPQAPRELADAMFFVTSAGLRGEKALDALTWSAKASAGGLGETAVIADAVTSAMNAYGHENMSAMRATDVLTAAVREGKLEASSLAPVIGRLLPTASKMGIEFEQVAGMLAVFSRTGTNAAEGTTSLNAIMSAMLKPTSQTTDALAKLGLTAEDLRTQAAGPEGLIGVFRMLDEQLDGNEEAMATIIPNIRAFKGVMNALAQDGATVDSVMQGVANSTGSAEHAFLTAAETADFKFKSALSTIQASMIRIGAQLMPAAADSAVRLANAIERVANAYLALGPGQQKAAKGLATFLVLAGPIALVLGKVFTAIGIGIRVFKIFYGATRFVVNGIRWIVAAAGGPMATVTKVLSAFGRVAAMVFKPVGIALKVVGGLFGTIARVIMVAVGAIAAALSVPIWVVAAVVAAVVVAAVVIIKNWNTIKSATGKAWNAVVNFVKAAASKILSFVQGMVGKVLSFWTKLKSMTMKEIAFAFGYILGYIVGTIARIIIAAARFGIDLAKRIGDGARNAYNAFMAGMRALPGAVSNLASSALNMFLNMARSIGNSIASLASSIAARARSIATGFMAGVRALPGLATSLFRRVVTAIYNMIRTAPAKVRSGLAALPGVVRSVSNSVVSAAKAVGKAIIDGIVAGVKAGAGAIRDAAVGAAKGALKGAKDALGIKSPSQVMAKEVGKPIAQGIAVGIGNSVKDVTSAMTKLVNDVRKTDTNSAVRGLTSAFNVARPVITQFFNMAGKRLDAYTRQTITAEMATIKLLAQGKMGNRLAAAYGKARVAVDQMRGAMPALEKQLENQKTKVDELSNSLGKLQNIQLAGTQAFSDQKFALEQQMKALELQQIDLKMNGVDEEDSGFLLIEDQLAKLKLSAERLDLVEALELDPLRRKWEATTNPIQEMSFDHAVSEFTRLTAEHAAQSAQLTTLQTHWESTTAAIEAYTAAMQQAMQVASDIQQAQQQSSQNQNKRQSLQTQISNAERRLNDLVKKGQGRTTSAANLRANIKKWKDQLSKIPAMAKGGIVTKPTLAMIGEGNESEAVMPLSKVEAHVEIGARRAAEFLQSQLGQNGGTQQGANDGAKSVTIENVEMKFYGEVDPFQASRDMRAAIVARMGGLV